MDSLAVRVKNSRRALGITQAELAALTYLKQADISKIENGIIRETTKIAQLAKALQVKSYWLSTGEGEEEPSNFHEANPRANVPLISWVRAGGWGEIDDHNPDTAQRVEAWHSKPSRYAFALTVDGDSMTASVGHSFPSGCTIIVDPERSPKAGDFVIAKDTSTQRATFKQLVTDQGVWMLRPLNPHPSYKVIEIDDPAMRVIGVVIEWQTGGKL